MKRSRIVGVGELTLQVQEVAAGNVRGS